MPRPPASQKAFTIIEVMVASVVLLVSFTGVIQAVTMGAEMIDTARKQQIAQQIIDGEIGAWRNFEWFPDTSQTVSVTISANGDGIDAPGGYNEPAYFYFTTNNNFDTGSGSDPNLALRLAAIGFTIGRQGTFSRSGTFRSITYTVSWTSPTGRTHKRTGTGYFAKNGLHLSYQK